MKTKLELSREMTINTGNFSNIKPSVSISLVHELEVTPEIYKQLSKILDSLMALETLALIEEMQTINQNGWGMYRQALESAFDDIRENLANAVRVIVDGQS